MAISKQYQQKESEGNMAISKHFTKGPYIRFYTARADADAFVKRYVEQLEGRLEYEFEIESLDVKVIGVESPFGNVSVAATDNFDALPDYIKKTEVLYFTDDIHQTLKAAHEVGINVLQEPTEVPVGFFALSPTLLASSTWVGTFSLYGLASGL